MFVAMAQASESRARLCCKQLARTWSLLALSPFRTFLHAHTLPWSEEAAFFLPPLSGNLAPYFFHLALSCNSSGYFRAAPLRPRLVYASQFCWHPALLLGFVCPIAPTSEL
ncbi:unnamed protein product [Prorocentrum cordatum]|uniref:Uncharacterized protein n=1 Tax=Prorocentrum cordatum TaxID=2364126 RepID=A0ABN9VBG4_9DINO|nr:unnamed protein product [Polarella glacialis]